MHLDRSVAQDFFQSLIADGVALYKVLQKNVDHLSLLACRQRTRQAEHYPDLQPTELTSVCIQCCTLVEGYKLERSDSRLCVSLPNAIAYSNTYSGSSLGIMLTRVVSDSRCIVHRDEGEAERDSEQRARQPKLKAHSCRDRLRAEKHTLGSILGSAR